MLVSCLGLRNAIEATGDVEKGDFVALLEKELQTNEGCLKVLQVHKVFVFKTGENLSIFICGWERSSREGTTDDTGKREDKCWSNGPEYTSGDATPAWMEELVLGQVTQRENKSVWGPNTVLINIKSMDGFS